VELRPVKLLIVEDNPFDIPSTVIASETFHCIVFRCAAIR